MSKLVRDPGLVWQGEYGESETGVSWGVCEQSNGMALIMVNAPGGVLTGKQLKVIADIVGEEGVVKNSRRMAPMLVLPKENVTDALKKLDEAGLKVANLHRSVRNIVSCPGHGFSKNSRGNTLELANILNEKFYGVVLPWDFKIGISGCPRNCAGVMCHDVGLMAEPRGKYSLYIGGTESGLSPKHGTLVKKGIQKEKLPQVIEKILEEYSRSGEEYQDQIKGRIRLYNVIEAAGMERFTQAIEEGILD